MKINSYKIAVCWASMLITSQAFAQIGRGQLDGRQNTITSAVPFLMITPDARAGAMGDAGVATPNDMNAIHWNASKLAFMENKGGVSLSYTPWLRALVPDVSLSYLSFYNQINKRSTVGGSLRYFSLGQIDFTDEGGFPQGTAVPNELAADFAYAQRLSENFSVGVAFRYIRSNLTGGIQLPNSIRAANSFAADITAYYTNSTMYEKKKINYGIGAAITNIGAKVTYTSAQFEDFIPTNLRFGGYGQIEVDKYNSIAILIDFNKLLIPTPPIYELNANGNIEYENGRPKIISGQRSDVPVVQGMIQSFYDAPGGFREEIQEINRSIGFEYWYDKQFALRAGYFYEPFEKGNRKYATMGAGLRYNVFTIDVAYLFSFQQRHPLDNTLRFTLGLDFAAFSANKNSGSKNNIFNNDPDR
jgi:hypothetical protein